MKTDQTDFSGINKGVLLVIAARSEAEAVCAGMGCAPGSLREWEACLLRPGLDLVLTGIGKANAAGAAAKCAGHHRVVLSIGIGGVLPPKEFRAGERILASRSVFADEGVETGEKFLTTADIGFGMPGVGESLLTPSEDLLKTLTPLVECRGAIATVSTCSGTDERAREVALRTGAVCEGMEGAAVGLVAQRLGLAFAEVRVISNTTGNRRAQQWNMRAALESLKQFAHELAAVI